MEKIKNKCNMTLYDVKRSNILSKFILIKYYCFVQIRCRKIKYTIQTDIAFYLLLCIENKSALVEFILAASNWIESLVFCFCCNYCTCSSCIKSTTLIHFQLHHTSSQTFWNDFSYKANLPSTVFLGYNRYVA